MKSKRLSLIISSIVVCLIAVIMSFGVFTPVAHASGATQTTEDKIYYSDLFYGYDTSYLTNSYIKDYYDDVDDVARDIFNDYINSPRYIWTKIETSIAAALNAKELFELMSDAYGNTNFNYTDAMDSANILFAKELIGENDSMKMIGDIEKITKPAGKIVELCNKYEETYNAEETHVVIIEKFFEMLYNSDIFDAHGKTYIYAIKTQFIAEAEAAGLWLSSSKELISYLKALSIGLMLEELRIEMLDDIIENSDGDQTIYTGMTRLKNQLVQGFSSYVVKTYMQDKAVDLIVSAMKKVVVDHVSAYGFVSDILEAASWVLFDVLFNIPDMDDMLVQMVLNEYTDGFHRILNKKVSSFKLQFDVDDIAEYELLVESLDASCKALMTASEKLTLSSNSSKLVTVKNRYKTFSYDNYIKVVKDIISVTPKADRKVKKFPEWTINEATTFTPASDTIEEGRIYQFKDGFYGNLVINIAFNIDSTMNVYGNVKVNKSLTIEEGASLTVDGNIVLSGCNRTLTNNGTINAVDLDINSWASSSYGYNGYYQTKADAVLNLTGNFSSNASYHCNITAGTVVFKGEEQQTVNNLQAYNVEVLNPNGIKYLSDTYVYGTYDLHGNPLDNNEYKTCLEDNADIIPGSNYRDLYISSTSDKVFSCDILCDNLSVASSVTIGENATVTVNNKITVNSGLVLSKGVNITVGEEVQIYSNMTIEEGASLTVDGNIVLSGCNRTLTNNGTVNAVDLDINSWASSSYGYNGYYQTKADAVLNLTGNFSSNASYHCNITAGTVVFKGEEQQTVNNLQAYNVEVLNPKGIKYLSDVKVYGNFDAHQNPIDMGSYKTNFYEGGGFGTLPENQSDWIVGVPPTNTTVGERYKECLVCGEKLCSEELPVVIKPTPDACEHSFEEWSAEALPTCTNSGLDTRKCMICDMQEERVTNALGHDNVQHLAQSATCIEYGWDTYETCTRCDYTTYAEIPAKGHTYGEWMQTVAPGSENKGEERRDCVDCDHYETREMEALGYVQAFVHAVEALSENESVENTYNALYFALQLYSKLTEEEKMEVNENFLILQAAIHAYNTKVETANTELKNATEIAFIPLSTSCTFLAALLFLLKKKFWGK